MRPRCDKNYKKCFLGSKEYLAEINATEDLFFLGNSINDAPSPILIPKSVRMTGYNMLGILRFCKC